MTGLLPIALIATPLLAGLACFLPQLRARPEPLVAVSTTLFLLLGGVLVVHVAAQGTLTSSYFLVDALSALLVLVICLVSGVALFYSWGYMRTEVAEGHYPASSLGSYYGWLNLFVAGMVLACVVSNLGMLWVALETTTIFSAILVGFSRRSTALEAAWKYLMICSVGIALALFGTSLVYYAALKRAGAGVDALNWTVLMHLTPHLDPSLIRLSFAFVLIGFGTKAGLAPMHTWLPDAHSQAPSPVSAVLSAALLNCSLYAILRFQAITVRVLGPDFSSHLMVVFGVLSVAVALPFIVVQHDVKRLLAYSSVEHIGLITVAAGIGGQVGLFAALLHLVNHALTKTTMFLTVGSIIQRLRTNNIARLRGALQSTPLLGSIFLAGALALGGAPPFSIFLSELALFSAAITHGFVVVAVLLLVLLAAIFGGLLNHSAQLVLGTPPHRVATTPINTGALALLVPIVGVVLLGLSIPQGLLTLIQQAAALLVPTGGL